jgi:hypothetical protein
MKLREGVEFKKLLIIYSFLVPCYFPPLSQNTFFSTLSSNTPSLPDQVPHPYTTTGKITFFYIPLITVLDRRLKNKTFCAE